MIPKIIHYCWFGHGELPDTAKQCIASWKKFCPEFEIKEWNEENFDINAHAYTKDAYSAKKYAFVSDYARYFILEKNGGIYMDVDVELVKPIDTFIDHELFLGRQDDGQVNPGLIMGSNANHWFLKKVLEFYDTHKFDTNVNVVSITTSLLESEGMSSRDNNEVIKGINIYNSNYFCPISYLTGILELRKESVSIHHFDGSWLTDEEKLRHTVLNKYINIFGKKYGTNIWILKYSIIDNGVINTIKKIITNILK